MLEPAVEGLPYIKAELLYAVREEMAQNLEDVLARRTRAKIQQAVPTMAAAAAVAALIAEDLGWDAAAVSDQATRFVESCQKELLSAGLELP